MAAGMMQQNQPLAQPAPAPQNPQPAQSPGLNLPAQLQTLAQVQQELQRLQTGVKGGDNAKHRGANDPSLESAPIGVVYVNGIPMIQGKPIDQTRPVHMKPAKKGDY